MNQNTFESALTASGWVVVPSQNLQISKDTATALPEAFLTTQQNYLPREIWKQGTTSGAKYCVFGSMKDVVININGAPGADTEFWPVDEIIDALTGQKRMRALQGLNDAYLSSSLSLRARADGLQAKVQDLTDQLAQAQADLTQARQNDGSTSKITQLESNLKAINSQLQTANYNIATLQASLDQANQQLAQTGEPTAPSPDFLDQTKNPYLPFFQFFGKTGNMEGAQWPDPRDMYPPTKEMQAIVAASGYEKMSRYERFMLAWKLTLPCNYEADDGDNHQLPVQTRARKKGDCEDWARLFMAWCRLLKILPDGVFNTTGSTSFGYHDWPLAQLSADEIKGTPVEKYGPGLYIYESTLTYEPPCPMPLIGSSYHVVDGLENWAFMGKVKPEFGAQFQLAVGNPAPGARSKMTKEEKRNLVKQLNHYHHDWHVKNGHNPPPLRED